jgi:hypothetical protein
MMRKTLLAALMVLAGVAITSSAVTPKVTVSPTRIAAPGHVIVRGTGFTPKANITSHLRRPDGAEYPVLNLLTNDKGEFTHDIDTIVLTLGIHDLWVVDDMSKAVSNRVQFEVTSNARD